MKSDEISADVLKRLSRIEGQIRGIKKMVEEGRYCMDILTQTRAVISAVKSAEEKILYRHLNTCVRESLASDDETAKSEKIDEIMTMLKKYR